jgi:glycosyltransferase involved in cell wall biosynthesis
VLKREPRFRKPRKMAIRLLYLTREPHPSFRPDIATLFGTSLPAQGIYTDLVALQEGSLPGVWPAGQAFVRKANGLAGRVFTRLLLAFDLFALSGRQMYAAIQVRDQVFGALIGLAAARWRRIPFFYWMSLPFPEAWQDMGASQADTSGSMLRRLGWRIRGTVAAWLLYRFVLPRADHVFVQSTAMREMLERRGIQVERMTPVPMGVAIPENLESIAPTSDPRLMGRRVVVYLGALERIRQPEIMLHAMVVVVRQVPEALLVLVGDSQTPGERSWLESEIQRLGLAGHAIITGWVPPELAWRYLRAASIGLSPFPRTRVLEVASPTKVCEYLAYGVPVIANDQPEQAYLLRETGGGLCVELSAKGFANGILELLAHPVQARQMAEAGRAAIARLRSYAVLGAQLAASYRQILKRPLLHDPQN